MYAMEELSDLTLTPRKAALNFGEALSPGYGEPKSRRSRSNTSRGALGCAASGLKRGAAPRGPQFHWRGPECEKVSSSSPHPLLKGCEL